MGLSEISNVSLIKYSKIIPTRTSIREKNKRNTTVRLVQPGTRVSFNKPRMNRNIERNKLKNENMIVE